MKRKEIVVPKLNLSKINNQSLQTSQFFELSDKATIKIENQTYEIKHKDLTETQILGQGEYGIVKKMVHKNGLQFAVKIISNNTIESNNKKTEALRDLEVSIKLGDSCPNLIRFYGAFNVDSYYWLLTEIMDTSLDRFYLKAFELNFHLPESFYSKIAISVLLALTYMRKLKIMHRDIKPSNILINASGEIKVCDFGISGFTNSKSLCETFIGCQRYMPPERLKLSDEGYGVKSDIWSLGISLIEIATGVHPYHCIKGVYELTTFILDKEPPSLDKNKFSEPFCSFVDQCLIKDENLRPSLSNLAKHPFIANYKNEQPVLLLTLFKFICDKIKEAS